MRFLISILMFLVIGLCGCASRDRTQEDTIVVWHWMSDRQSSFEELAKDYEQATGIKVTFDVFFPPDVYSQKIQAAAAAKDLPDLFGILADKKIFASYIKSGYVENLFSYMTEDRPRWKRSFIGIGLKFNTFRKNNIYDVPPGIYGVPIDMMSIQFLYNKDLLEKAGFDPEGPPKSWDEFITIAKKASQEKGIYGFVSGWGENWLIYCLVTNYAYNIMGEKKFFDTMRGKVAYTDPDWVRIFTLFKEMKDAGILASGIITMNNKEAEQFFANNKAVFGFNGSWGANTYYQMNPDLRYDTMLPPAVSTKFVPKIWASAGSSFVVNALSSNKDKAIDFLKWLTAKEQQLFLMKKTRNLPSVKGLEEDIDPTIAKFAKNINNSTHPNLWLLNEEPRVIEAINTGIQRIIIGEATPEEVAEQVQKAKQLTLEKK